MTFQFATSKLTQQFSLKKTKSIKKRHKKKIKQFTKLQKQLQKAIKQQIKTLKKKKLKYLPTLFESQKWTFQTTNYQKTLTVQMKMTKWSSYRLVNQEFWTLLNWRRLKFTLQQRKWRQFKLRQLTRLFQLVLTQR